jgi:hypothetical protein
VGRGCCKAGTGDGELEGGEDAEEVGVESIDAGVEGGVAPCNEPGRGGEVSVGVGVADAMQGDPSSVVVSRRVEEDCCGGVDVGAGWCCSSRGEAGWNACDGGALGCCCAAGSVTGCSTCTVCEAGCSCPGAWEMLLT